MRCLSLLTSWAPSTVLLSMSSMGLPRLRAPKGAFNSPVLEARHSLPLRTLRRAFPSGPQVSAWCKKGFCTPMTICCMALTEATQGASCSRHLTCPRTNTLRRSPWLSLAQAKPRNGPARRSSADEHPTGTRALSKSLLPLGHLPVQ